MTAGPRDCDCSQPPELVELQSHPRGIPGMRIKKGVVYGGLVLTSPPYTVGFR